MPDTPDIDLANRRNALLALFRIANTKKGSWLDPIEAYTARYGEAPAVTGIDVEAFDFGDVEAASRPDKGFAKWIEVYKRRLTLKQPPDKCPRCKSVAFIEQSGTGKHYRKIVCGVCGRWLHWVSWMRDLDLRTYRPKA